MKKTTCIAVILGSLLFFSSCTKKEDSVTPDSNNTNTGGGDDVTTVDSSSIYYVKAANIDLSVDINTSSATSLSTGFNQGRYPSGDKDFYMTYNSSITSSTKDVTLSLVGLATNYDTEPVNFKSLITTPGMVNIMDSTFDYLTSPLSIEVSYWEYGTETAYSSYTAIGSEDFFEVTNVISEEVNAYGDTMYYTTIEGTMSVTLATASGASPFRLENVAFKYLFESR